MDYDLTCITNWNNTSGSLFVAMAPGKQTSSMQRNLIADFEAMLNEDINVIVCLLTWKELIRLNMLDYPTTAQNYGFIFLHCPIRDGSSPDIDDLTSLVKQITYLLNQGNRVLIHCRAGLGRAGLISACCLKAAGYSLFEAATIVRYRRPGAIQTQRQMDRLMEYYS